MALFCTIPISEVKEGGGGRKPSNTIDISIPVPLNQTLQTLFSFSCLFPSGWLGEAVH